MANNATLDKRIAATARMVREAVGVPPIGCWQYGGVPSLIAESYLFPSRKTVVLPKFPVPVLGIQFDGRKVVCRRETAAGSESFAFAIPNRCVLIPPDTESYWAPGPGNLTLSGIYIGGEGEAALRAILGDKREPAMLRDAVLVALTRQLLSLATDLRPKPSGYDDHLIAYLVAHLQWLANAPLASRLVRTTVYDATISDILLLIDEHIEQPLTIDTLAAAAGISPALFRKRFTEIMGVPVHHYVLKTRIERASELIDQCNLPLAIVASQCGFSSQSHMTKIFKRELGATPAELRRRASDNGATQAARSVLRY